MAIERTMTSVHVVPINDTYPHDEGGLACDCIPQVVTGEADDETGLWLKYGVPLVIHNVYNGKL